MLKLQAFYNSFCASHLILNIASRLRLLSTDNVRVLVINRLVYNSGSRSTFWHRLKWLFLPLSFLFHLIYPIHWIMHLMLHFALIYFLLYHIIGQVKLFTDLLEFGCIYFWVAGMVAQLANFLGFAGLLKLLYVFLNVG